MREIFHLATCTTCQAIFKETNIHLKGLIMQDIKVQNITAADLDELKKLSGSYESLFSKRAIKYRELGLAKKQLNEADYRQLILQEYTFLKRPVVVIDHQIFTGSEKKTIIQLKATSLNLSDKK